MKVTILKYSQVSIAGCLTVLDVNKIIDIQEEEAQQLINAGIASSCEFDANNELTTENKMINILYKKRGRPRKEV